MATTHYIVATAGHVDHGKSSLVKALTGIDPDRLPEEKARGITIDLGFAHLELPAPPTPDPASRDRADQPAITFSVGLVDVPGHEDFVKNMVAGVGSIDLALFVVAADDGWMPQTEEHLQILTYLRVKHAVIALTKIDLVEGSEAAVVERVRASLQNSPFADALIVPTSVVSGRGLEDLKSGLMTTLATVPPPRDLHKPRLPIDRVFTLRGIGTVVTGTLNGGALRRGQTVVLQPSGAITRVRALQSHNREVEQANPGTRVALNLPDMTLATGTNDCVARGHVVTIAELGVATNTVDVLLEKSDRLRDENAGAARPLRDGTLLRLHHGSANIPARVKLREGAPLLRGQRAIAQLRLVGPMFLLGGDRFILRDGPEQLTLAGGVVLDPDASRKQFHVPVRQQTLQQRADALHEPAVWIRTELERNHAIRHAGLLLRSRFSADEVIAALARMGLEKAVAAAGDWVAASDWWRQLRDRAAAAVHFEHRAHPERSGLDLNELRRAVGSDLPADELFEALLADLCRSDFIQTSNAIRHRSHRPALPPQLQAAGAKLRAALSARPMEPPARKELTPDTASHQALRFLIEAGGVTDLGPELVISSEAFNHARETIRKYLQEHGQATASALRQLLNTNRRVIIPLLEKLDKDGLTQRREDVRVLRKA